MDWFPFTQPPDQVITRGLVFDDSTIGVPGAVNTDNIPGSTIGFELIQHAAHQNSSAEFLLIQADTGGDDSKGL